MKPATARKRWTRIAIFPVGGRPAVALSSGLPPPRHNGKRQRAAANNPKSEIHNKSMLSQEENDLLTRTGPGTPGGNFLRRYWQPVALSEELPANGAPLPVRIMSEDLVLYRDDQGQLGLLGLHCSHRRADLSYGRVENGGLRCLYHGWLFDRRGNCPEQPCEPVGKRFCEKVHHPAYPCRE